MRRCIFAATILVLGFGAQGSLAAHQPGDADVVKQVLDAWQKRRKAMKSVMYKVDGLETYPKGSMTEDTPQAHPRMRKNFPPNDVTFPTRTEYMIDFPKGKIRKERREHILHEPLAEFCPRTRIQLFDGKKVTLYEPREENTSELYTPSENQPELLLYKEKGGTRFILRTDDYPILFAHGLPPAYNAVIEIGGCFDRPPESSLFRFHDRGSIGDRVCIILRTLVDVGPGGASTSFGLISNEMEPFFVGKVIT